MTEVAVFDTKPYDRTALSAGGSDVQWRFLEHRLSAQTAGSARGAAVAKELGLAVARVPAYSPYAVAEHAVALLLALNRKIHLASNRVREMNFFLSGIEGFDLHGKTVGIKGTVLVPGRGKR